MLDWSQMWEQELPVSGGEPGSGSPSRTHVAWPATISTSVILTALGKGTMDVRECGGCCHKGACQRER